MDKFHSLVKSDYENWKNTPPNVIQHVFGKITKPIEIILNPFIKKIAPLLEGVLRGLNNFIANAISNWSGKIVNLDKLPEKEFKAWFKKADNKAKNIATAGITSLVAEGAGTGLGGFALLAADIPASFGLIIGFANKIALTYQLDITNETVQVELLKAISTGSETTINGKLESASTLKVVANVISKQTWKEMEKAPVNALPKLIFVIRSILKQMGINITKRKALQIIPVAGAVVGGVINGTWGADVFEAVRQYSRLNVVETYYKRKK